MVESISQGRCTDCGHSDDNFRVTTRTYHDHDNDPEEEPTGITREVECDCGAEATVNISEDGVTAEGAITYEDASWTDESDDEEDDE